MVKPTLLVLAAGMGSRYGSLKQMDGVGPNNEAIIDYSVYDAIRAGFGKVVFVIRHSFEKEFREVFSADRFGGRIAVDFVFQELDYLPEGLAVPEGRVKPWGTNHAVMMAADAVHEPFAVINADDFYGAEAYKTIGDYLSQLGDSKNRYCMVAYDLNQTLSDNGTVIARRLRRGCRRQPDVDGRAYADRAHARRPNSSSTTAAPTRACRGYPRFDEPLRLHARLLRLLEGVLSSRFEAENRENLKSEFYIPTMVNKLIGEGAAYPARAAFGGPVARRHLQGGQTRADGLDREDDCRG